MDRRRGHGGGEFGDLCVERDEIAVAAEDGDELDGAEGEVHRGVRRQREVGGVLRGLPPESLHAAHADEGRGTQEAAHQASQSVVLSAGT